MVTATCERPSFENLCDGMLIVCFASTRVLVEDVGYVGLFYYQTKPTHCYTVRRYRPRPKQAYLGGSTSFKGETIFLINLCSKLSYCKFPIINSTHHLLPSPDGELAPAISAYLDVWGTEVMVVVAHNGQGEQSSILCLVFQCLPVIQRRHLWTGNFKQLS